VYMYAAVALRRREELMEIDEVEPEMMYAVLARLPQPLDLEALIAETRELMRRFPPQGLPGGAWRGVSRFSVLKTTGDVREVGRQRLEEGEAWLAKQAVEVEREEARKRFVERTKRVVVRYRRPAGAVTLAVVVGVLSVWFGGRNGGSSTQLAGLLGSLGWVRQRVLYTVYKLLGQWQS